jgi:hypothetical protein
MTDGNPALAPFEALIGTWDTEIKHRLMDEVVTGTATYEWLEGGHFILLRSHVDHPAFPDGLAIIGAPEHGDGLVHEHFDSRGVRRTYRTSIENGVLRLWRDQPGFDQRMTATLADDAFQALVELAEAPGEWKEDMRTTYRRRPT